MVHYKPRSSWGARPPKPGPGPMTPSRVDGVVIHWPGSGETDSFDSNAEIASALRGWQTFHMNDRGWSDIAYQIAVDQDGGVWTLRGFGTQSGANGNVALNERYGAILLILVTGEQPSAAMKASVRAVIGDFRDRFPRGTEIRPHSAVRPEGTDCPGPAARAALARGEFTPGHLDPPGDDMATEAEWKAFIENTVQAYSDRNATNLRQQLTTLVTTLQGVADTLKAQVTNYAKSLDAVNDARDTAVDAENDQAVAALQGQINTVAEQVAAIKALLEDQDLPPVDPPADGA